MKIKSNDGFSTCFTNASFLSTLAIFERRMLLRYLWYSCFYTTTCLSLQLFLYCLFAIFSCVLRADILGAAVFYLIYMQIAYTAISCNIASLNKLVKKKKIKVLQI